MAGHTQSPEAHSKAVTKYIKYHIDRLELRVPKESGLKEKISKHAMARRESINAFLIRAVTEQMKRDGETTV